MFERKKQAGKIYFLPIDQISRRRFRHGGSSASRSWLRWPRASVKMSAAAHLGAKSVGWRLRAGSRGAAAPCLPPC